jgi:hypothetical protein
VPQGWLTMPAQQPWSSVDLRALLQAHLGTPNRPRTTPVDESDPLKLSLVGRGTTFTAQGSRRQCQSLSAMSRDVPADWNPSATRRTAYTRYIALNPKDRQQHIISMVYSVQ